MSQFRIFRALQCPEPNGRFMLRLLSLRSPPFDVSS